jgi:hypothetical protein
MPMSRLIVRRSAAIAALALAACAPANQPETAASPVVGVMRRTEIVSGENGVMLDRRADDGTVVGKIVAPANVVWDALVAALSDRKMTPSILDRAVGRAGDTALVMMRRWNGEALSRYLSCGVTLTGQRADEERIRAILLAQMSRLPADTIAVAVHFSARSQPVQSGNAGQITPCTSTGLAEKQLIDDVTRRVRRGGAGGA